MAQSSWDGERNAPAINEALWQACAGPLVSLPPVGSLVVYFPQGHREQVSASTQKDVEAHVPSDLACILYNVSLQAHQGTDEVYANMALQPVNTYAKEELALRQVLYQYAKEELALRQARSQMEFFCKKLTVSDVASGWLYVPRRDAENVFPSMDYSLQLPSQVLVAKDIHGTIWAFSHKFQGQRHLLNTGWTTFVTDKGLSAGDSVIFVRDEKQQLLVGIRRASREPTNISASILPSDSILAAAAPFTISYYPWDSPSEFVIPFAKYQKAVCNQISLGMRFHMMFETEELEKRRCMGTITGISDLDPVRWKNSQWRSLQVDESASGERRNRVSIWEIEPLCPQPFFGVKRQLDDKSAEMESLLKRAMPSLGEEVCIKDPQTQSATMPGLSLVQWMNMNEQQSSSLASTAMQSQYHPSSSNLMMQNIGADDLARQLYMQNHLQQNNIQFNPPKLHQQMNHLANEVCINDPQTQSATMPDLSLVQWMNMNEQQSSSLASTSMQSEYHPTLSNLLMQNIGAIRNNQDHQRQQQSSNQAIPLSQAQTNIVQAQVILQNQMQQQQQQKHQLPSPTQNQHGASGQQLLQSHQLQDQILQLQQQQLLLQQQLQQQQQQQLNKLPGQLVNLSNQQTQLSDQELCLQLLQNLQQQSLMLQALLEEVLGLLLLHQRMSIFIKVFKRGAIGRVIDIGSLSGFGELNQALARIFGIEGQLEDLQRKGWRLVYTDHEGEFLLLGDIPWGEFVKCVKSIRILSPQELQKLSLDDNLGTNVGDLGTNVLPNFGNPLIRTPGTLPSASMANSNDLT